MSVEADKELSEHSAAEELGCVLSWEYHPLSMGLSLTVSNLEGFPIATPCFFPEQHLTRRLVVEN